MQRDADHVILANGITKVDCDVVTQLASESYVTVSPGVVIKAWVGVDIESGSSNPDQGTHARHLDLPIDFACVNAAGDKRGS
jgi:hypothetical protein